MLDVPRSVRLAAWGVAVLRQEVEVDRAVRAVTGLDEPHGVATASGPEPGPPGTPGQGGEPGEVATTLPDLLAVWARTGISSLRVVLPVAGDLLGLPGPAAFNTRALEAGECVLADRTVDGVWVPQAHWGAVPEITEYGSVYERGYLVQWQLHRVPPRPALTVATLAEADRELKQALMEATAELARLDVARWREDAADRVLAVRDGGLPRTALPPSAPPRSVEVLGRAARVRAIVELAAEDDGASVSAYEAQRRAQALRGLDGVARRAMVAAVAGLSEPSPPPP